MLLGLVFGLFFDNGLLVVVRHFVKVRPLNVAHAIGIGSPSVVTCVELAGLDEILNVVLGLAPVALSVATLLGLVGVLILVAVLSKVLGEGVLVVGHGHDWFGGLWWLWWW